MLLSAHTHRNCVLSANGIPRNEAQQGALTAPCHLPSIGPPPRLFGRLAHDHSTHPARRCNIEVPPHPQVIHAVQDCRGPQLRLYLLFTDIVDIIKCSTMKACHNQPGAPPVQRPVTATRKSLRDSTFSALPSRLPGYYYYCGAPSKLTPNITLLAFVRQNLFVGFIGFCLQLSGRDVY